MEDAVNRLKTIFEDLIYDKKRLVKVLSVLLILLLAGILRIHNANKADISVETAGTDETEISETSEADTSSLKICVDIGGQVENPGVYQISEGTRLYQLVELAGGFTKLADKDSINQASYVEDGEKIIIPARTAEGEAASGSGEGSAAETAAAASSGLININTADKDELKKLNGIGDVMAERIIEYRKSNRFKSKEDIKSVKGIGDGIFEKIKDDITC